MIKNAIYLFESVVENLYIMQNSEFINLKMNGFIDSYVCIENAMKYYDNDPMVCCSLFRKALESIIVDVYSLFGGSIEGHNKRDIDNLDEVIPDAFYDDNIILEMNNVRIIGNAYAHHGESDERDVSKDKLTCYIAMKKIAEWLADCKLRYPAYLKEQEERMKERKETRKKIIKAVGKIVGGVLTIAVAILGGKKMTRK